jgi:OmpA-OmpF porin, OOP family
MKYLQHLSIQNTKYFFIYFLAFAYSLISTAQERKAKLLPSVINAAESDEINPLCTPQNNKIYFTRNNVPKSNSQQDIYYTTQNEENTWQESKEFSKLNNKKNNAIGSITSNKKHYLLNTYKGNKKNISVCTVNEKGELSTPKEVFEEPIFNEKGTVSFCVSNDDSIMIISMFTEQLHKHDLFISNHLPGGWSKPRTLGRNLNTEYDEITPSLSADRTYLFFSSNRNNNNYDIYYCKKLDDSNTSYTTPKYLGNEVNTNSDFEAYFTVDSTFTNAYFSAPGINKTSLDIYQINTKDIAELNSRKITVKGKTKVNASLHGTIDELFKLNGYRYFKSARSLNTQSLLEAPEQRNFLDYTPQRDFNGLDTIQSLVCFDKMLKYCDTVNYIVEVERPVQTEIFIVKDKKTFKEILKAKIALNKDTINTFAPGEAVKLKPGTTNSVMVFAEGYYPFYKTISTEIAKEDFERKVEILLNPIAVGLSIGLSNILFETGKAVLKQESYDELDILVQELIRNTKMKIFISGHTDNVGNSTKNMKLSDDRVKSVINYLVDKKVPATQISGKGYGDTKPIDSNSTQTGRDKNRRVEFEVLNF